MPNDFYRAAGSQTTTARELANELGRFANDLKQASEGLYEELQNIANAKADIKEEITHTAGTFIKNTLDELEGDEFDTIAEIAQGVEELSAQGLAYARHAMMDERERALAFVNETLDHAVDALGFQEAKKQALENYDAAYHKIITANKALETAEDALQRWEDTSVEDDLVRLNESVEKAGGVSLSSDNRDYYEGNIFVAMWRYTSSGSYRKVRHALEEYGHGRNGKDAFADLPNFQRKYEGFNNAIESAQSDYNDAKSALDKTAEQTSVFEKAGSVRTDEQILEAIQAKIQEDLINCPAFITAMLAHYAEDFPRSLPLLVAKQATLEKLESGTKDKLSDVRQDYRKISEQYAKMSKLSPSQKIKRDLEEFKKQNKARSASYNRYRKAARDGWTRTRDYDYDYNRYDNDSDLLTTILIYNMLTDNDDGYHQGDRFEAGENSKFAADLIGVDEKSGEEMGLPGSTFDLSEEASAEFEEIGVGSSFNLDNEDTNDPFELAQDELSSAPDTGSSINLDEDTSDPFSNDNDDFGSSPSFGGPSIGS